MADQYALSHIQSILKGSSLSCADFGLPHTGDIIDVGEICPTDNNLDELRQSEAIMASLNEDQRALVDSILQAIDTITSGCPPKCHAYFLDGPGGSGKTRVYNTLISYLNCKHIKVASAAWTGIAATLLMGGRTAHNLFKLPVPILDTSTCNISPSSPNAHYLRSVMLFIIDEASMVPVHALSAIDKMMRDITNVDVPFGAKIFLLGGDFRQVLPAVPRSSRTVIVEHCLKSSPLWPLFTVHRLKKNMRAKENESEFANWLLELGNGTLPSPDHETFPNAIKIPDTCNIVQSDIVTEVFSDITDVQALADRVILTPTNAETLKLNNHLLDKLPGETEVYFSVDKAVCDTEEAANYPMEFLNNITPSGMPPHELRLKTGAIIMLLRNLDITRGLCNGTRLIIRHLHNRVIDAKILTGSSAGLRVLIPWIKHAPSDVSLPFTLERTQLPIRLAYSMTINKSQGQTFSKLGIYLPSPVFSHGQLYVAFSRARSFSDIYVEIESCLTQGALFTQNVVYKEVL